MKRSKNTEIILTTSVIMLQNIKLISFVVSEISMFTDEQRDEGSLFHDSTSNEIKKEKKKKKGKDSLLQCKHFAVLLPLYVETVGFIP